MIRRTLPLLNHALELVVDNENLNTDSKLTRSLKLHGCHTEGGVTIDVNDSFVRRCDLRPNGRRKTEAHRLQIVSVINRQHVEYRSLLRDLPR